MIDCTPEHYSQGKGSWSKMCLGNTGYFPFHASFWLREVCLLFCQSVFGQNLSARLTAERGQLNKRDRKLKFREGKWLTWGLTASGKSLPALHGTASRKLHYVQPSTLVPVFYEQQPMFTTYGLTAFLLFHNPLPLRLVLCLCHILDVRKFIFQNDSFGSANCKARLQ